MAFFFDLQSRLLALLAFVPLSLSVRYILGALGPSTFPHSGLLLLVAALGFIYAVCAAPPARTGCALVLLLCAGCLRLLYVVQSDQLEAWTKGGPLAACWIVVAVLHSSWLKSTTA